MSYVQNATRRFLLTSLALLVLSSAVHGQTSRDESARRQVTAVGGLGNAMGWLGVAAELYFSGGRLSGVGGVGYTLDPTGLTFAAGVRAYTLGIKHRGFAELSLSQQVVTSPPAFLGEGGRYYGPGIQVGYQYVTAGGFTFVVSAGVGYALDVDEFVSSRVAGMGSLGFGYTWRRP